MLATNLSISVVIPNYNGRELLEKNIPSLLAALDNIRHEIIVVDDDSNDDSVEYLEEHYPDIIIIKNNKNMGFSVTCNNGIKRAQNSIACITNTDVTFTKDYFINAIGHFTIPGIFAVKGNIINYDKDINDIMNTEKTTLLYYKRGLLRFNQKIKPAKGPMKAAIGSQFVLLGCCFVCRKKMLDELGGYDEIYSPFYWEDADLAIRALKKGYKLVYEKNCVIYHQTSSTIGTHRSNRQRRLISIRNKFIFTWRHLYGTSNWIQHIIFLLINLATRWLKLDWKYYVSLYMAVIAITK